MVPPWKMVRVEPRRLHLYGEVNSSVVRGGLGNKQGYADAPVFPEDDKVKNEAPCARKGATRTNPQTPLGNLRQFAKGLSPP